MNKDEQEKRAEQLLEAALKRYADAEPRPGLETRLLATIAAERPEREQNRGWRAWWTWAAVAAVALIAIAITVAVTRESKQPLTRVIAQRAPVQQRPAPSVTPSDQQQVAAVKVPTKGTPRAPRITTAPVLVAHSSGRSAPAPKRPQFPTPEPLTEQERLLLAYARATPKLEIETVIAQREQFEKNGFGVSEEQEKSDR
jgi:hypothetical protein